MREGDSQLRLGQILRKWRRAEDKTLHEVAGEMKLKLKTLQRLETNNGNAEISGGTLARVLVWLLADDVPTVSTAHDRQKSKSHL